MKYLFVSLLFIFCFHYSYSQSETIEGAFNQIKAKINGSDRDCYVVKYLTGDLDGDGQTDGLAFYACGIKGNAGNASAGQGWAVFLKKQGKFFHKLTDEETFGIIPLYIQANGVVVSEQLEHAKDDPNCCPSIKKTRKVQLKNNTLVIIQ
ncbi:MAG: hypothetical protein EAZ97_09475 [Bacteroidetes bacterium]|nr:MAG: hypothetical protein EAZ97_09475 [Bacteroidota bacterium]